MLETPAAALADLPRGCTKLRSNELILRILTRDKLCCRPHTVCKLKLVGTLICIEYILLPCVLCANNSGEFAIQLYIYHTSNPWGRVPI